MRRGSVCAASAVGRGVTLGAEGAAARETVGGAENGLHSGTAGAVPGLVAGAPTTVPIVSRPRSAVPTSNAAEPARRWCLERGCAWRMVPSGRRGKGLVSTRPATCGDFERQGPTDRGRHPTTATVRRPRASHGQAGARPHDERSARRRRPLRVRVRSHPRHPASRRGGLRASCRAGSATWMDRPGRTAGTPFVPTSRGSGGSRSSWSCCTTRHWWSGSRAGSSASTCSSSSPAS